MQTSAIGANLKFRFIILNMTLTSFRSKYFHVYLQEYKQITEKERNCLSVFTSSADFPQINSNKYRLL